MVQLGEETVIATLSLGMVVPQQAYAQFGLLGGIQNKLRNASSNSIPDLLFRSGFIASPHA